MNYLAGRNEFEGMAGVPPSHVLEPFLPVLAIASGTAPMTEPAPEFYAQGGPAGLPGRANLSMIRTRKSVNKRKTGRN
jgi:hypothetical protein